VSHFLKHQLSVTLVLDISLGQALALTESAAEFVTRCVCVCWGGGVGQGGTRRASGLVWVACGLGARWDLVQEGRRQTRLSGSCIWWQRGRRGGHQK